MYIKTIHETDDGSIVFEGHLPPNEVKFMVEVGINFLLQQGAIKITSSDDEVEDGEDEGEDVVVDDDTEVEVPEELLAAFTNGSKH